MSAPKKYSKPADGPVQKSGTRRRARFTEPSGIRKARPQLTEEAARYRMTDLPAVEPTRELEFKPRTRRTLRPGETANTKRNSIHAHETHERARLHGALDRALDSMWMAYQPIVQARTGALFGYEALLRSGDPALEGPNCILDAAEKLGRIHDVGRVVRRKASEPMPDVEPPTLLFINLHAIDLNDATLTSPTAPLTQIASRVVLEITERASLEGIADVPCRVARLRELGFRIAIDDLGAGYSGLKSFAQLGPEFVKLDISLVRDVHQHPLKQKLIRSMTALCKDMGTTVVAEGIECAEERDAIIDLGCDLLQGFLLARPGRAFPKVRP